MVMEEEMLNPAAIDEDDLAVLAFFKRKLRIARESFKEAHPDKPDERLLTLWRRKFLSSLLNTPVGARLCLRGLHIFGQIVSIIWRQLSTGLGEPFGHERKRFDRPILLASCRIGSVLLKTSP